MRIFEEPHEANWIHWMQRAVQTLGRMTTTGDTRARPRARVGARQEDHDRDPRPEREPVQEPEHQPDPKPDCESGYEPERLIAAP